MAKFKFNDPNDKNKKERFDRKFDLPDENLIPMEKKDYPLVEQSRKERLSFEKYLELDESYNVINETLEEISKTNKCTIEQADVLNTNFAKLLVGIYQLNKKNLHSFYFKKLTQHDYDALNKHLLSFINSSLTFDDICSDVEKGIDLKKQIRDSFSCVFYDAFSKDFNLCYEENYTELIHLHTLQTSIVFGFIASRDIKKRIRANRYFTFEYLDDVEVQVISDISCLLALTYPYNGSIVKFNINDFFPIKKKLSEYSKQIEKFANKDWKDKAEWLNSKLEELHEQGKVMDLSEKILFESVLYQVSTEITIPREGEDIEKTRELARNTVLDPYFKAFFAYYSGDEKGYDRNMEIAKKALLKLIYLIDFEKSNKNTDSK
ncbi:MAG: hypothetical protein N3G74_00285 [Candidatus Micrarchaeota archaeon]|nr:hypothetical protein [Candidatus Micrarchaeota archaeon]